MSFGGQILKLPIEANVAQALFAHVSHYPLVTAEYSLPKAAILVICARGVFAVAGAVLIMTPLRSSTSQYVEKALTATYYSL